jgi:hypothetical protein
MPPYDPVADSRRSWQSGRMRLIDELISPSAKRKVRLYEREDGRFWFEEIYEDFDEDAGVYWTPGYQSGIFADAGSAKAEMLAVTPWLR